MKKYRKIGLTLIIIILVGLCGIMIFKRNEIKKIDDEKEKEKYYLNLKEEMYEKYNEYYQTKLTNKEKNSDVIKITLKNLKDAKISVEDFVSYKHKKPCDENKTYGLRIVHNGKYKLLIKYSCGDDEN